jgi:tetratricopeptide (TPR) repeat protein
MRLWLAVVLSWMVFGTGQAPTLHVCLIPIYWSDADYFDTAYQEALFEQVRVRLEQQSVSLEVQFEAFDCDEGKPTIINFTESWSDGPSVYFERFWRETVAHERLLELSPLLYIENAQRNPLIYWRRLIRAYYDAPELPALIAGMLLYDSDQPELALPHLFDAVDEADSAWPAAFYAGNVALMNGDYEEAAELYKRVIEDAPSIEEAFEESVNLAWTYLQLDQPDTAFEVMHVQADDAANRYPFTDLRDLLAVRAQLHALNFDFDAAIWDIDAAVALDPENPALYVLRGRIVLLLYEWDRVLENYNTAIEIDPEYPDAYYWRGLLYYTVVVDRENALLDFERYQELAPEGVYAEQAADYAEAIRAELAALER